MTGRTLRTGSHAGPLPLLYKIGLVAGFLVPLVLVAGLLWSALRTADHSHVHDTMSELGALGAEEPLPFNVANVVVGALIILFVVPTVGRRAPIGLPSVVALAVTGICAVLIGLIRCTAGCPPLLDGHASATDKVHAFILVIDLLAIVGMPFFAWRAIRDPLWTGFRRLSGYWWPVLMGLGAWAVAAGATGSWLPGLAERLFFVAGMGWLVVLLAAIIRYRSGPGSEPLVLEDLQSNVVLGSKNWTSSAYCFYVAPNGASGRQFVADLLNDGVVSPQVPWGASPTSANSTVAFTFEGLQLLRPEVERERLPDAFVEGMSARATSVLGDQEPWDDKWKQPIHIVAWTSAASDIDLDGQLARVQAAADRADLVGFERRAKALPGGREHFGFVDGLSQPWLDLGWGRDRSDLGPASGGKVGPGGVWKPIARGEFLLGEMNERKERTAVPEPAELFMKGTYLVIRQLEQRVDDFRAFFGGDDISESLVGRTKKGAPLARTRDEEVGVEAFDYADDPEGFNCPLGAHVRRANPRRTDDFDGALTTPRRIIRRGMPYGPLYDDEPDAERGLMFAAFNARIDQQFEFIQRFWLNDGDRQRQGRDPDPIAGNWATDAYITIQDPSVPRTVGPLPRVVVAKGGGYFFVPSMAGLCYLATASTGVSLPPRRHLPDAGERVAQDGKALAFNLFTVTPRTRLLLQRFNIWNGDRSDWYARNLLKNRTLRDTLKTFDVFHTARWIDLRRIRVDVGQPRENYWHGWSIFCGVFNGEWDSYIRALWDLIPEELWSIWGQSVDWPGFPTPGTATEVERWLHDRMPRNDVFYAACPEATAKEIRGALRVDRELHSFMLSVDSGAETDRVRGYERLKRSLQHNLSQAGRPPVPTPMLGAGTIRSFAAFSPVRDGREAELRRSLQGFDRHVFARLPGTHFARLFLIDKDEDKKHRPDLANSWLVFVADHDGGTGHYLGALEAELGAIAANPWALCHGAERWALPEYLRRCQVRPIGDWGLLRRLLPLGGNRPRVVLEFFDYEDSSLADVVRGLDARRRLGDVVRVGGNADSALDEARDLYA